MEDNHQRTEKFLFVAFSILLAVLVFNFYTQDPRMTPTVSAESSGGDDEGSSKSSDNDDDSKSEDDDSKSESSQSKSDEEKSTTTTTNSRVVKTESSDDTSEDGELSTEDVDTEKSTSSDDTEESVDDDQTELSGPDDELSEPSAKPLVVNGKQLEVVSTEGSVSLVRHQERLFFLVPVEIESEVVQDEAGNIVSQRQSFFNWLKAILSL